MFGLLKLKAVRFVKIPCVAMDATFISLTCVFGPCNYVFLMITNLTKQQQQISLSVA